MRGRWNKHIKYLKFLENNDINKSLLKDISKDQLNTLSEILLNIYQGVIPLNTREVEDLRPFKKNIEILITKNISLTKKKHILLRSVPMVSMVIRTFRKYVKRNGTNRS